MKCFKKNTHSVEQTCKIFATFIHLIIHEEGNIFEKEFKKSILDNLKNTFNTSGNRTAKWTKEMEKGPPLLDGEDIVEGFTETQDVLLLCARWLGRYQREDEKSQTRENLEKNKKGTMNNKDES